MTNQGELIGIKDPNGFRPLCLGKLNGSYVLSSESCALDLVQAEFIRELDPGEIVIIDDNGVKSIKTSIPTGKIVLHIRIHLFRAPGQHHLRQERVSGEKSPRQAACTGIAGGRRPGHAPFSDSGNYAALGYHEESGIPLEMGMIRNHYVGRTFIQPSQSMRDFGVRVKLNPVRELLKGKDIIIIEDSIIRGRGTTAKTRVKALRELGVKRVHMRVAGPPAQTPLPLWNRFFDQWRTHRQQQIRGRIAGLSWLGLSRLSQPERTSGGHRHRTPGKPFLQSLFRRVLSGRIRRSINQGLSRSTVTKTPQGGPNMLETKYLQDNVKNIQLLMTIPGLHNFEAQKLGGLLRLSKIRTYFEGEVIMRQGDEDPWLYFMLSGSVKIEKDEVEIARLKKPGEIFGEMRIITGQSRSASIFALEKTMCLAVDTSAKDRLQNQDERTELLLFLFKIFSEYTSARLRLTNEELIKCKKQLIKLGVEQEID